MSEYFYSTQSFLAWCLNHYFYDGRHYVWAAALFYPYKMPNPKSSNPYQIYADLYSPWYDRDPFDRFISSVRLSLRKGVIAAGPHLSGRTQSRLKRVCAGVDVAFFLPIVYRIDISVISSSRLNGSVGSGATGSNEYLIRDLRENEFDILFLDERHFDKDMGQLATGSLDPSHALSILEGRVN